MKLEGSYSVKARIQTVWDLLIDPKVLASCTPGCDKLEPIGEDSYKASLSLGVSAIKGTFTGSIKIIDKRPPNSLKLVMEGSGGMGFVKGEGVLSLSEEGNGTTLIRVEGESQIGGAIARVGQRLFSSTAKHLMNQFFNCLQKSV